jgi:hypothetical protein
MMLLMILNNYIVFVLLKKKDMILLNHSRKSIQMLSPVVEEWEAVLLLKWED